MTRASPDDDDVPVRPAATVVVLRDAQSGLEVLLLQRSTKLVFHGGAWVFPGGRIDAQDLAAARDPLHAARIAAARELREEAALVATAPLVHFARWLTPPGRPRRFDAWYFVTSAPPGEVAVDRGEVVQHRWISPHGALAQRAEGELELPPATFVTLTTLLPYANAAQAQAALAAAGLRRFEPRPCPVQGGTCHLYAGDAGYAARDPDAAGPRHRLWALESGWRYEH